MSEDRPKPGTKEFDEWMIERAKARGQTIFNDGPADFDERGVISGGDESIYSSDAESFPDERGVPPRGKET